MWMWNSVQIYFLWKQRYIFKFVSLRILLLSKGIIIILLNRAFQNTVEILWKDSTLWHNTLEKTWTQQQPFNKIIFHYPTEFCFVLSVVINHTVYQNSNFKYILMHLKTAIYSYYININSCCIITSWKTETLLDFFHIFCDRRQVCTYIFFFFYLILKCCDGWSMRKTNIVIKYIWNEVRNSVREIP